MYVFVYASSGDALQGEATLSVELAYASLLPDARFEPRQALSRCRNVPVIYPARGERLIQTALAQLR